MREKSPCAALNRTPSANGGAVPASDHLSIARRSAQADDHATKTLLFEAPFSFNRNNLVHSEIDITFAQTLDNGAGKTTPARLSFQWRKTSARLANVISV